MLVCIGHHHQSCHATVQGRPLQSSYSQVQEGGTGVCPGDTCQRAAHLLRTAPDMTIAFCPYITRTTAGPVIPTAATQQHQATISNSQLLSKVLTCATAAGLDARHRRCSQVCSYCYCHHGCHSLVAVHAGSPMCMRQACHAYRPPSLLPPAPAWAVVGTAAQPCAHGGWH